MAKKDFFDPVNAKIDFPAMERRLLDDWYKKGIVAKYLGKNKNSNKYFSFLDGQITPWEFTTLGEELIKTFGKDLKTCKGLGKDSKTVLTAKVFG
ncbi:MAG: hypothetical protein AAB875_03335 [Patescibacteria group bacterium]